ncbi:MAG: ketopantoate reductase family protein [Hyphomicrobiales bacterium]|nr:ketopantoate reductase family protein [Hyphomicrobiales bacterium]MCP4998388.1 ketopantoate reductase family protein [Hyphomicrobiales bacterium]
MRTLFFGAGPLGSVYAHLLHEAGSDVTVLARGERHDWLKENGLVLVNEMTGQRNSSRVNVVSELKPDDQYDLVIVLIRKNKLLPVFEILAASRGVKNILFMGNNALGFEVYLKRLPVEKVLFGFPGAGGGIREHVVHYCDREKPKGKRRAVTIGEVDGFSKERTLAVKSLFESAGIPVELTRDIDGWLKYHAALVLPLAGALYKHDCDNYQASKDKQTLRSAVRAAKEGGRVLRALGFRKRQPFAFNMFYWLPEFIIIMSVKRLLESKFAEVAFSMHAEAARDEIKSLAHEFRELTAKTSVDTPNIDTLRIYIV